MNHYTLSDPVFRIYVIAAALAILKMVFHAFFVVARMVGANGGFLNAEDTRQTFGNPKASPSPNDPNERVERARRMQRNEGENTPYFLGAGLIFVSASPPVWLAAVLLYGYVVARVLHFWAYATAQNHEVRAAFFSLGAVITVVLVVYALAAAIAA